MMKHGTVTQEQIKTASGVLEAVADGQPVHLTDFGDGVKDGKDDVVAMIIRELSSEKQIQEFLRRHGISVRK